MATKEREVLSSAGGLATTVAVEAHGELGEAVEAIRARGYWENVWRRFRRDRVAIASGIFIVFLILTAFAGAPIAAHFLGHGPNYQFGLNATDTGGVPLGPGHTVSTAPYLGAIHPGGGVWPKTYLILGGDGSTGRDEFLRILYGA